MLREDIEATLVVGIVASFLKQSGKAHLMSQIWLGVTLAVLCECTKPRVLLGNSCNNRFRQPETLVKLISQESISYPPLRQFQNGFDKGFSLKPNPTFLSCLKSVLFRQIMRYQCHHQSGDHNQNHTHARHHRHGFPQ